MQNVNVCSRTAAAAATVALALALATMPFHKKQHWQSLTSLQERCVDSIIRNWGNISLPKNSPNMRLLCNQNALILRQILSNLIIDQETAGKISQQYHRREQEFKMRNDVDLEKLLFFASIALLVWAGLST
jgi:hypothetical protein